MSSLMSKRQQARNEKALQDLVHSVVGNQTCADCHARNPAWASWSLGIFLCMRCAAIHRKLGTHISKVKSLSMDGWTNEQVENMRRVGNIASNKIYNPDNKHPPVPVDADEADSAMERFIRSKYMQRAATPNGAARHHTGRSVESDEGTPPPLPPKTGGKFFSKAKTSSTFPLSFRSKKTPTPVEEPRNPRELRNKPSKVFGASVQSDSVEDTARKLTQLRDMGFMDDKRNAMVLKGVNGNLEKTIEALVRLGEGNSPSASLAPRRESSLPPPNAFPTPRSLSPAPATPTTAGLSRASPSTAHSPATSNNPWDISPAPPQSSQSTGTLPNTNPFYSMNPFGAPSQHSEFALNGSMQNLSLAPQPQQQLFPHHTGGLPAPQPLQQPIYQQSMTPPLPQNQNFGSIAFNSNHTYTQPFQQQPTQQSYNPFLQAPTAQQPLSLNTSQLPNQGGLGNNPFMKSPTRIASPSLNQIPEQSQQNFYGTPQSPSGNNPFFGMSQPAQQYQPQPAQQYQPQPTQQSQSYDQAIFQPQQQQQQQQPQYQLSPQATSPYQAPRDKASILALYNYPSMAPSPMQPQDQNTTHGAVSQPATQQVAPQASPQRSASTPLAGNKNPFLNGGASPPAGPFATVGNPVPSGGARSRESMTLGFEMAWNNGRHSPDAFASLSARGP
ncbi:hypothetical protein JX266_003752 [Neoarthrinium moseri]|nr:hypothetical protein JX266_003752 [Neoarthrinium moseri]